MRTRAVLVENHKPRVDGGDPYLYDPACNPQREGVAVELDESFAANPSGTKNLERLQRRQDPHGNSRVLVTIIGSFRSSHGVGFGHLGWAENQFTIKSIENARAISPTTPYPRWLADRERRIDITELEALKTLDQYLSLYVSGACALKGEVTDQLDGGYRVTLPEGNILSKSEFEAKGSCRKFDKAEHRINNAHIYGSRAVVTSVITLLNNSNPVYRARVQNAYVRHGGLWHVVSSQVSEIVLSD